MFLGGAGLADYMLYCRNQIYPLGLSNGLSHFLTVIAVLVSLIFGIRARFLPQSSRPVRISLIRDGQLAGRFAVLIVTTRSEEHTSELQSLMRISYAVFCL